MPNYESHFMQLMHDRNFIHQVTDERELDAMMARHQVTAYIGLIALLTAFM